MCNCYFKLLIFVIILFGNQHWEPSNAAYFIIYSLFPSFVGLMEGLGEDRREIFVNKHIPKSFSGYGPMFSRCVLGSGYFFSTPLFLLFRSWFGDTINRGHLERYFLFLEILNTIFFCIYLLALSNYAHMEVINPSRRMWNYKLLKTHLNSTLNVPNRLVWVEQPSTIALSLDVHN